MAEPGGTINLKILSPSTEIEGGIFLPDLPVSTTIKGLRQKIHDAAPSKPATNRMRLIYRGRVVANDDDKLADVFPVEEVGRPSPDIHGSLLTVPVACIQGTEPPFSLARASRQCNRLITGPAVLNSPAKSLPASARPAAKPAADESLPRPATAPTPVAAPSPSAASSPPSKHASPSSSPASGGAVATAPADGSPGSPVAGRA
jgi:hypothetical protein